jgi:hypothetical protein
VEKSRTPSKGLLHRLFIEEFSRIGKDSVPECEICFYAYTGLTNTIRARNGRILIRVSDLLADAPPEILRSVVAILIHKLFRFQIDEEVRLRYRRFIGQPEFRQRLQRVRRQRGSKHLSSPQGKVYDLLPLFQELNQTYFKDKLRIRHVCWSQRANRTTLGHFDSAHGAIILNKRLDNSRVPPYVVSYVLYHEMLHAYLGEEQSGNSRRIHHRRFREAEKRFRYYSEAKSFIRDRYHRLKMT